METLAETYQKNADFIDKFTIENWISLMKLTAKALTVSQEEKLAIDGAGNYIVEYESNKIQRIVLTTDTLTYNDFKIVLNIHHISISQQEGHTTFKEKTIIPTVLLRSIVNFIFKFQT